jgi:tetratricopeptide (TPR) repeat protein
VGENEDAAMKQSNATRERRLLTVVLALVAVVASACAGSQKARTARAKQVAQKPAPAAGVNAGAEAQAGAAAAAESDPAADAEPGQADEAGAAALAESRRGPAPTGLVEDARKAVRRGQHEAAIRKCKAALRRDEKYTPAMEVMALAYFHLGKTEFAESICDIALGIRASSGRCYNLKGLIALRSEDAPRALEQFKKATEADRNYAAGWNNLGAQYLEVKNYTVAVPALERAVQLKETPEAQLNLGAAYRGAGELAKAEQAFRTALKLRARYGAAYFNLGILYLDAEKYPGLSRSEQLQRAVTNLNRYRQLRQPRNKDDEADTYIKVAEREMEREQRRIQRDQRRKAREAAKKAEAEAKGDADSQPEPGAAQ